MFYLCKMLYISAFNSYMECQTKFSSKINLCQKTKQNILCKQALNCDILFNSFFAKQFYSIYLWMKLYNCRYKNIFKNLQNR